MGGKSSAPVFHAKPIALGNLCVVCVVFSFPFPFLLWGVSCVWRVGVCRGVWRVARGRGVSAYVGVVVFFVKGGEELGKGRVLIEHQVLLGQHLPRSRDRRVHSLLSLKNK